MKSGQYLLKKRTFMISMLWAVFAQILSESSHCLFFFKNYIRAIMATVMNILNMRLSNNTVFSRSKRRMNVARLDCSLKNVVMVVGHTNLGWQSMDQLYRLIEVMWHTKISLDTQKLVSTGSLQEPLNPFVPFAPNRLHYYHS